MRNMIICAALLAVAAFMVGPAAGQGPTIFNFSTDLGSDLDRSDPNNPNTPNDFMDCGDMYIEGSATALPTRIKDDSLSVYPADGDADGDGPNTGYPYQTALQPLPALVGAGNNVALPSVVEEQYEQYFDLDADDQIEWSIHESYDASSGNVVVVPVQYAMPMMGVSYEPTTIALSFEDDGAPGWYNSGDVPTMAMPDRAIEIVTDTGAFWGGPGVSWSPSTLANARDEVALGLAPNPPGMESDDDVDALDTQQHQFWYWSPDHEANMGDDPGSIYETDKQAGNIVSKTLVIDDSAPAAATGLWIGILQDTDVDAWEFVAIGYDTYVDIFSADPIGANHDDWILCGLFSPDADDPDTVGVNDLYGDESGGMNDGDVWITNLLGKTVLMASYEQGVDALTVPEPSTMVMLLMVLMGLIAYRRR